MKRIFQIIILVALMSSFNLAHIPQPEDSSELTQNQIKKISKVIGVHHKKGSSHDVLHKAIIKLYKKWGIKYKKVNLQK